MSHLAPVSSPNNPPNPPPTHGGKRPGAGAPRGPRPATIARQAAIYALFDDPAERALLAHISPLDIIEIASRRLLADGRLFAAAHLAALAAPYRHFRKRTVVTDPAGLPIPPASPTALGGFGGVEPEPLRPLQPTDPVHRDIVINRIPRGARKGKRCAG